MAKLASKRTGGGRRVHALLLGALAAAVAAAAWVAPASAEVVYETEAPAPAPIAPPSPTPPPTITLPHGPSLSLKRKMRVSFPSHNARLAGPGALVQAKCNGSAAARCIGTLSFSAAGGTHKVPFSISKGRKQYLVIPLGGDDERISSLRSPRAVVTARTVQQSGAAVKTSRVLTIG